MPRIHSMDVTINGTTRTFAFDPPAVVGSDDPGEGSLELLQDAETTEVEMSTRQAYEVSLTITRTQLVRQTVTVAAEDEDEAREWAERDFDAECDTDWDYAENQDTEVVVEEVDEYGDEEDADYSA